MSRQLGVYPHRELCRLSRPGWKGSRVGNGTSKGQVFGEQGTPRRTLTKLGRISEQAERFPKSLASDSRIETRLGKWAAVNFKNGSVEYDAEFQGDVSDSDATIFARNLELLADYDPEERLNASISTPTAVERPNVMVK